MTTANGLHQSCPLWTEAERARWPNFTPQELACKGSGEYWHDPRALDALQALRVAMGAPLHINSGHRSRAHNARVGGASRSMHLTWAVDISVKGHDRAKLLREAIKTGFTGIGLGGTFLHCDMRARPTVWLYGGTLTPWAKALGYNPLTRFARTGLFGFL